MHKNDEARKKKDEPTEPASADSRLKVYDSEGDADDRDPTTGAPHNDSEYRAPWWVRRPWRTLRTPKTIIAIIGVVVLGIYTYFAKQQVTATRDTLAQAQSQFALSNRAWIWNTHTNPESLSLGSVEPPISIEFQFINSGRVPALDVHLKVGWAILETVPPEPTFHWIDNDYGGLIVAPGGSGKVTFHIEDSAELRRDLQLVRADIAGLFITAVCEYHDDFGRRYSRWTQCYRPSFGSWEYFRALCTIR